MNDLIHIEAEVRNLGLRYQVPAGMALWGKIEQIWSKVAYNDPLYVLVVRYINSSHMDRFDHIALKMPSKFKLARNGPKGYNLTSCSEVCPFMATFDAAQLVLANFEELSLNWLRLSFDTKEWQTLHKTNCNGPIWPHLVNGDHVWSRVWSMNDIVHIEAEVHNLGLRYQFMAGMSLWGKIAQIWLKVTYNTPVYVLVS